MVAATSFEGMSVRRFAPGDLPATVGPDSVLGRDLRRFDAYSEGWVALHPELPEVLGDVRYALLPNEIAPLWGVSFDVDAPERRVRFGEFRRLTPERRRGFIGMLRGEAGPKP
jgi:inner membrane protein